MNAQCCKVRMVGREGKPTGGSVACSQAKEGGEDEKVEAGMRRSEEGRGRRPPPPALPRPLLMLSQGNKRREEVKRGAKGSIVESLP